MLASATRATATSSMAAIATSGWMPSMVPFTSASRLPAGRSSRASTPSAPAAGENGTMIAPTASAAGVLMTEAIRIVPSAFGITGPRMVA